MKIKIIIACVLALMLYSSCKSTYKKAYDGVFKAYQKNTAGARDASLALWPFQTKDSVSIQYLPGDSVPIPGPVVYIDCDSALAAQKANPTAPKTSNKVAVKCPESYLLTDTLKYFSMQISEDTRKVDKAHDSIAKLHKAIYKKDIEIANLTQDYKDTKRKNTRLWIVISAFSAYMVLRIIVRFKFPFIYKFLP